MRGRGNVRAKKLVQGGLALLLWFTAVAPVWARITVTHTGDTFFDGPYMQTKGTASLLVIPVDFPDEPTMTGTTAQLNEIFFGGGGSALASVADYYSRSSYGELAITGQVQEWYRAKHDRSYYSSEGDQVLIQEILEAMLGRGVDLSQYDSDGDGVLDGVCLVWTGQPKSDSSVWWPHSDTFYWNFQVGGVRIGSYSSLSYRHLTMGSAKQRNTALHEIGHLLGLPDYYDRVPESGNSGGCLSPDMMDQNQGDHNAFSKMLLGWVRPTVVTADTRITLRSISREASAAVVVPQSWDGNYLSEYFMIEYVTPDGNHRDIACPEGGAVRIWHISAATSKWTYDATSGMFMNDNSETKDKLIVIADPSHSWYLEGESLAEDMTCLYGGEATGISIQVERITGEEAVLSVTYGTGEGTSNQSGDSRQVNSEMSGESSIPPGDSEDSQNRDAESSTAQSEPFVDSESTAEGAASAPPAEESGYESGLPQSGEGEKDADQESADGRDSAGPISDKPENAQVDAGAAGAILITVALLVLIWLIIRPRPKRKKRKGAKRRRR